jgi:hypothetical protein
MYTSVVLVALCRCGISINPPFFFSVQLLTTCQLERSGQLKACNLSVSRHLTLIHLEALPVFQESGVYQAEITVNQLPRSFPTLLLRRHGLPRCSKSKEKSHVHLETH